MLRDTLIATAAAMAVVCAFLWSEAHPRRRGVAPEEPSRAVLDRRIPGEVHIQGSFREAIRQLVELGCPINSRWSEDWPYDDRPDAINLTLRDATVEQWIDSVLFQLGGRESRCWIDTNGRIDLGIDRWRDPPSAWCVYDVRDLIEESAQFSARFPCGNLSTRPDDPSWKQRDDIATELADVLKVAATGYVWNWEGGGTFSGREFGLLRNYHEGFIEVMHTPPLHRKIEVLLAALRARR